MRTARLIAASAACLILFAQPAAAQMVQRIAAVVNDEVVSVLDLQQRVRVVLYSTGITDTPETTFADWPQKT